MTTSDKTSQHRPSLKSRFQYGFDNFMSRGTLALISGLGLLSRAIILLAGAIVSLGGLFTAPTGNTVGMTFGEAVWASLMRTLDPGTMGGDEGWGFRFTMLAVTIGGILIVSALIGVLTSGIESKMNDLRKGRSHVLESGHILILGWSPQIFTILSELIEANLDQPKARIVILADQDKIEMENEIQARVTLHGKTRIICRSGLPIDLNDIEIGSPNSARAIIILPPEGSEADSHVIKTILAITNHPNRNPNPYHIVTQVHNPDNLEVIRLLSQRDNIQPVLVGDLISRLTAQTSRQPGLSVVYTELLNFKGDEIYFQESASLVGKTYAQALLAYEDSAVMGISQPDGTIQLNPPMNTLLQPGDQIFALSANDDTIITSDLSYFPIDETIMQPISSSAKLRIEHTLILGWNNCATIILRELDHYVSKGSQIDIVTSQDVQSEFASCCHDYKNQKVHLRQADPTHRRVLDDLKVADYDHVIVLSEAGLDVQSADARTLVTLLHLRDLSERDDTPFSIVSEMLDLRNRQLAEVTHVDDFIISEHLVSLVMCQLAENPKLHAIFMDIFDPEGSEIYLKPVCDYVRSGVPVNFYTLVASASQRGETAIGYRLEHQSNDPAESYGIHTNPKKSVQVTFSLQDKLIVLAER